MNTSSVLRKAVKAAALIPGMAKPRRRGDIAILLYHRVGVDAREISLTTAAFDAQMAWLKTQDRALSLDDALTSDHGGVVVTVDDGYRDFYENALPVLTRHRVPVLLYLATGLVEGPALNGEALSWSMLRDAVSTGLVSIGAHTHNHADLSRADASEADREMRRSKELIEDSLQVPCKHFAYPWAVGSRAAKEAAENLFETSALYAWRTNRRGRIERHALGRTPILRSDGQRFFRAKVRGMLDHESFAYRIACRGPWRFR